MQWPVREERLLTVQHYCGSSKSLEGDCGMDRVTRMPSFNAISRRYTLTLVSSRKNLNSARWHTGS